MVSYSGHSLRVSVHLLPETPLKVAGGPAVSDFPLYCSNQKQHCVKNCKELHLCGHGLSTTKRTVVTQNKIQKG